MVRDEEIQEFLHFISSEKGLSPNTRDSYRIDLNQFFDFCGSQKRQLLTADDALIRKFLAHLRRNDIGARSSSRKITSLKQFYAFLFREGRIGHDPTELVSVRVKTKKLPKHLTMEEIERLLMAPDSSSEEGVRDRALLEVWYATGCRVSEILSLEERQFDWKGQFVKVKGKGNRERLQPIHPTSIEWCKRYRDIRHEWERRFNLGTSPQFFLTKRGKSFTRQSLWRLVKTYGEKAGITRPVWPHMIRHTFATHVLRGGADLRAVQELLGHKTITTAEVYTHLNVQNLKAMQLKYHPRR